MIKGTLSLVALLAVSVLLWPSEAQCVRCDTSPCITNATCGAFCLCYKGKREVRGRCVPK